MDSQDNPFNPGAGFPPPELAGRDYLTSEFKVALGRRINRRHGKHMFLIGLRGIGKTVLLNHSCSLAEEMNYEVVFLEVKATESKSGGFLRILAKDIGDLLPYLTKGLASRASDKIRRALSAFSVNLSADGVSISVDPNRKDYPIDTDFIEKDLTNLFVAVGEAAAVQEKGILIAIDEVQDLTQHELAAVLAAAHRIDQLQLPLLLIGAGLLNLPGKAGNAKSYAERLVDFPRLYPLPEKDAKAALVVPAEKKGVSIQETALDEMIDKSGGYPYFIQEWGKRTWNAASGNTITADDVRRAEPVVEKSLDENFFATRTDRLTRREIEFLGAMASLGPGPHKLADIAIEMQVKSSTISPRRQDLIDKGMIYSPSYGELAFSVPMFDDYIKRVEDRV